MSPEQHEQHGSEPRQTPQSARQERWRRYGVTLWVCARTIACKAIQAWLKSEIQEWFQRCLTVLLGCRDHSQVTPGKGQLCRPVWGEGGTAGSPEILTRKSPTPVAPRCTA